ncbi:MFS transporter [Psychrosphaera sp. B3R10]|uniref:MFS transporter n=1 Tax=Psychrosphaera algicola TaxID=3023714 RepID=A0ABT5FEU0_9GAMM|nr:MULTISPECIES: MFS transporter [unclassified Psychrosphaera]MBU2882540.1 MFS transporter [Psychrosphaera sp. I2R16]MBU2989442.1 MFS transporter [Psychrosphaera sp. B3R10]MDC2889408.1 MFS transporter [Psychrosphaera sp. G1-22]MDO6718276.1 MFS transporter [Psychrosphaera sp. 1_MG-2023]
MLSIQKKLSAPFYMLLSLPSTAMGFALSVQISALSWLLSTQYGLDIHEIGIVWAAGPIAGILGQVIVGFISDKVWFWNGRRRPFIIIGGVLASLSLLALPNIGIINESLGHVGLMAVAIAVALSLDLSINVSFNPTRSIIADVTPAGEQRTLGYTWMQTISGTFGVLAYVIGGFWNNFLLIYFGAALVLLFSVIPALFIEEPKVLEGENKEADVKFSWYEVLSDIKPLWGFLVYSIYASVLHLTGFEVKHYYFEILALLITLYFVFETLSKNENDFSESDAKHLGFKKVLAAHSFSWIGIQTMFVFCYAFLQEKMSTLTTEELGQTISYSFAILNAVAALLPALVLGPLAIKFGRIQVHAYALLVTAVAYALIAFFATTPMIMYLFMALAGIGWSAVVSLPFAIMSERVENAKMGLYMGLFNLSVVLPQLVVSLGVSLFLNKADDKSMVFVVCAISMTISAVSWLMIKEKPVPDVNAN